MSKILAVPPKSISAKDKQEAIKAGFIVIEVADPSKIVVIDEHQIINGNDLAMVALETICESNLSSDGLRGGFTSRLYRKLKAQQPQSDKK